MDHLFGMYLSKLHEIETMVVDEEEEPELMQEEESEKQKLLEQLQNYGRDVGFEHSVYIQREHGEDISLMTEIVTQQSDSTLFPRKTEDTEGENHTFWTQAGHRRS